MIDMMPNQSNAVSDIKKSWWQMMKEDKMLNSIEGGREI